MPETDIRHRTSDILPPAYNRVMIRRSLKLGLAGLSLTFVAAFVQDSDKDHLRRALNDNDLVGTWIYDDLSAGYAEATKSGKPLLVVIRCVP